MDRATVLTAVIDTAVELLKLDPATVTETSTWAEDLEADSLDLTELVMALEDRFEVEVPEESLEGVKTVGDAADVVMAAVSESSAS
ncbi:acyl carrier protein [Iamia sp. SCSIO 61187]|uniref:acyl carrier protein n=1 Tax=Iamia sp. SCSIO 61187 TaxID=2722752 RepID=UPI001C63ADF8|nr:acyl carrier protein [Iamia sp. SCSIO 61187]QYG92057.1 acyl carrier protein [Iamia sp. SCSIO 61187]